MSTTEVAAMYHRSADGCEAYYEGADGVWRYGGHTDEAACDAAGR